MRLKERHEHENTFIVQDPHNLVEVGLAFFDSLWLVINRDGVKCTLVNCELEKVSIRVQIRKVGDIADFEGERQVLRLGFLHLLHDLVFVIDTLDDKVVHFQFGQEFLREVRITATWHQHFLGFVLLLDVLFQVSLQILEACVPFETLFEPVEFEELLPVRFILELSLILWQEVHRSLEWFGWFV